MSDLPSLILFLLLFRTAMSFVSSSVVLNSFAMIIFALFHFFYFSAIQ